jgi:regulator of protease activity HflC (stomatin/prohibitin superfamily)
MLAMYDPATKKVNWKSVLSYLLFPLFCVIVFIVCNPVVIIGPSDRGVVVQLGEVQDVILQPGLHFRNPFIQQVKKYTVTPFEFDYVIEVGRDGAITSDNQTIGVKLNLYWSYKPDEVTNIARQYTKESIESILKSSLISSVKATLGKYTIFDLAKNQTKLSDEAFNEVKAITDKYPILITQLNLTNFDWSDSFDRNIEETQNKAQQVNQKEQELKIADLESQKQVKIAESERNALIAKAEGEKQQNILIAEGELAATRLQAEAKVVEGEAIRKYNEKIAQNLNVQIRLKELENEARRIEKWNGAYVPTNNYGPIPVQTGAIQGR